MKQDPLNGMVGRVFLRRERRGKKRRAAGEMIFDAVNFVGRGKVAEKGGKLPSSARVRVDLRLPI